MRFVIILLLVMSCTVDADVELLIVGDRNSPVRFVVLPFTYHGSGISPAITVENKIVEAISSTGLFTMPYRYEQPKDIANLMAWQLEDIRFVLEGDLYEENQALNLKLSIYDTLGLQPTLSMVVLNPDQLALSSQIFADQVYRSLFYATFTNDNEKQYLNNENATLTRYLNQLVTEFKMAWKNNVSQGSCTVKIQQIPGGVPFKSRLSKDCFEDQSMATEVQRVLDQIDVLPYDDYQEVFEKNLTIQFIGHR